MTPEVAASEHDLIMMARALVTPQAYDVLGMICRSRKLPPAIGPTCAALVEEALRQIWPELWRRSGARVATAIVDGVAVQGRGWERHAPVALEFSPATLSLLRWLIATPLTAATARIEQLPARQLAVGDQVAIYLALDAAGDTPAVQAIARQPLVRAAPLAWLGFPDRMAAPDASFDSLTDGAGAIVIEALAPELADRWRALELAKRRLADPEAVIRLGATQDAVLARFMDACDARGRRDLATFVIDAAAPLFERDLAPMPPLDPQSSLSARAAARVAAGSLLRAVVRWHGWDQQHRGVRFIDDGYAAAQVLLARFERIGAAGVARATAWLSELASLAPTTSEPANMQAP